MAETAFEYLLHAPAEQPIVMEVCSYSSLPAMLGPHAGSDLANAFPPACA